MKISPAQRLVLTRMADGWELGQSHQWTWLQKHGIGNGGPTRTVSRATFRSLCEHRLVHHYQRDPFATTKIYTLTEAGHAALGPAADSLGDSL